jgi:hypothetical protein
MTPQALKAALLDLAEFGWVFVDNKADAEEIAKAAPVKVTISESTRHKNLFWVEVDHSEILCRQKN